MAGHADDGREAMLADVMNRKGEVGLLGKTQNRGKGGEVSGEEKGSRRHR